MSDREYLLVTGPDEHGSFVVQWSGTDTHMAMSLQVEHPEWSGWTICEAWSPSTREGLIPPGQT